MYPLATCIDLKLTNNSIPLYRYRSDFAGPAFSLRYAKFSLSKIVTGRFGPVYIQEG